MPYQQVHPIISVSGVQQKNEHFFSYKTEKMSENALEKSLKYIPYLNQQSGKEKKNNTEAV
jgi:hypothetical protein